MSQETAQLSPAPVKIRPASGWSALEFAAVWEFRDLLIALARRDVKLRYKQTFLGVAWVVLQPLLAAGIFSFVFGLVAKMPSDGKSYFLFSYCGLLGWNLFNNTVTRTSTCLISNSHLVSKIYFPRLVLPFSTLPSALIDFAVALVMLAVMMVLYHTPVTAAILFFPLWIVLISMLAMGLGLWTSALTVSYRDVQYILPVALQLLLYGSPIAYAVSAVPPRLRTYFDLNPLASVMEGIRWSLLGTPHPEWRYVLYSLAVSLLLLASGTIAFKNMERRFADVI